MNAEQIARALGGARRVGDGWLAHCLAHDDRTPSLALNDSPDGKVLIHCHAGCSQADVIAGLKARGLWSAGATAQGSPQIVATYPYDDESGKVLYEVVRFEPKDFRQRRPDGHGGWIWNLNGVRRVMYRLPGLLENGARKTIFVVEGEKDADRLAELGFVATTNCGGAGKWRDEYNKHFSGAHGAILPDNDRPGEDHARHVARELLSVAKTVRIVRLPGLSEKGDVSDWLAAGGTREKLIELVASTPALTADALDKLPKSLGRLASEIKPEAVDWLIDGYIPLAKLTLIAGDPGEGKTLVTADLAARVTTGAAWPDGRRCADGGVLILSAEDGAADTILPRLIAAGADRRKVRVVGVEDDLDALSDGVKELESVIAAERVRLVVIDPLNSFLGDNINPHQDASVRRALKPLATLAARTGAAVIVIFHLNKDGGKDGKAALYRPTGSIGFVAASRAAFLLAPNPTNANEKVLAPLKFNLGPKPPSWAFTIIEVKIEAATEPIKTARIEWTGETDLAADALTGRPPGKSDDGKLDQAMAFLHGILSEGAKPHRAIIEGKRANGITEATLRRARERLGVISFQPKSKTGKRGSAGWLWRLPGGAGESDAQPPGDEQVNPEPPTTGEKGTQKQGIFARESDDHESGDHRDDQVNPGAFEDLE